MKRLKKNFLTTEKKPLSMRKQVAASFSSPPLLHRKATKASKGSGKAIKRSKRLPTARALQQAGLPPPATCKPGSKEYGALQAKWYDKLEAGGFDDLEWTARAGGGKGQNSDYLKGSSAQGRAWSPERAQFYRLLQNYLTHHNFKRNRLAKRTLTRLNEGMTYRQILAECRRIHGLRRSLYWFYYYVQDLVAGMVAWNGTDAEGMLNPANADSWADDALLSDLRGTAGVIEAPNGLKLDQGWWLENMAEWWRSNGGH